MHARTFEFKHVVFPTFLVQDAPIMPWPPYHAPYHAPIIVLIKWLTSIIDWKYGGKLNNAGWDDVKMQAYTIL